ncbi:DUF6454 family protein [Sinomonas sp. ASV322]|uniref:DUF6454 family protein n=1 Tax=Sinomonas sp. ASV322 TaxID=3041920 RepID=UPI0027DB8B53|nr:DUF6454 family protein [Sinomonas sp. ASV322]MDQ4504161.1 DUF6454 family protein [Sinomonas sp. ASV322]
MRGTHWVWAEPPRDGSLSSEVQTWSRRTRFELVRRLPLRFPTHHPQGMAFSGGRIFLSTVELFERPVPVPESGPDMAFPADPALRTEGRGRGHVLVIDPDGTLVADVPVGDGDAYHPGGIDVAGGVLWVPVAEYRAESRSIVYTLDLGTLEPTARFTVADHVSWLAADSTAGELYGASWGSRRFYRWRLDGLAVKDGGREPEAWGNPSAFVDFQDAQYDGAGRLIAAGVAELPDARGDVFELGGIAVVDLVERRLAAEVPVPAFSAAGHTITRNPFVLTRSGGETLLHVAPDDGDEPAGTEQLTYRVRHDSRPDPRPGRLTALA